ncbi:MAG: hypothetical protein ABEH65_06910 [Halobacteriales archaeon]
MSDADPGAVTVSADGVTVHKYVDTEEFDALAVVFEIEIDRETPVSITLSDPIPDGIPAEDVGIHPEYGGEYWTIMEETVTFERRLEDEDSYTTLYGVRTDDDDVDRFAVEPALSVEAPSDTPSTESDAGAAEDPLADSEAESDVEAAEDILGDSDKYGSVESSDIVREVISGERETVPGMQSEAETSPAGDDTAAETADEPMEPLGPESEPGEPITAEGGATVDTDDAEPSDAPSAPEPAEDAETDSVTSDQPTAGEESTPTDTATPTTMNDDDPREEPSAMDEPSAASEGEDAAGTTDATPADEPDEVTPADDSADDREMITVPATGGVARLLVKELQEGHVDEKWRHQLRDALAVDEPVETGSIDARIEHLQSEVSDLAAYTEALEEFLNEKGAGRDLIDSIENGMETLQDTTDRLEDRIDSGEETLSDLEETVSALEDDIDDLHDELAKQDELADRIDDLVADMESMTEDIEEIKEFRDRMSAVFNQQTPDE